MLALEKSLFEEFPKGDGILENYLLIFPEQKKCPTCNDDLIVNKKGKNGAILTKILFKCHIFTSTCNNNECQNATVYSFKGEEGGYVNFNNKYIIPVEVIKEYFDQFVASGATMKSFLQTFFIKIQILSPFAMHPTPILDNNRGYLHQVVCEASEYINFEFPMCCQKPKYIGMDGLVASVRQENTAEYTPLFSIPSINGRATVRGDRQFILSKVEMSDVERIINGDEISENWKIHDQVAFRCLYYCRDSNKKLRENAKPFAGCLTKSVNPASGFLHDEIDGFLIR